VGRKHRTHTLSDLTGILKTHFIARCTAYPPLSLPPCFRRLTIPEQGHTAYLDKHYLSWLLYFSLSLSLSIYIYIYIYKVKINLSL
jgi:hypothetical protein